MKPMVGLGLALILISLLALTPNNQCGWVVLHSSGAPISILSVNDHVAFIFQTDNNSAASYQELLQLYSITEDLVPRSQAQGWNYSGYGLIMIGSDVSGLNSSTVSAIDHAGKPILGLGFGGYDFFGNLNLTIGWPNGASDSSPLPRYISILDDTHEIFHYPNPISIPPYETIQLYSSTGIEEIYLASPVAGVTPLGRDANDTLFGRYPLIEESTENKTCVLWGFTASPDYMVQTGKDLFVNTVEWLLSQTSRYPWPMFRYDAAHTGQTESPAPKTNETFWINYVADGGGMESSPALANGRLYIGCNNGWLYCLDAITGTSSWSYPVDTDYSVRSSPAVAYNKVYVASRGGMIVCLDSFTGSLVWDRSLNREFDSSPTVADGRMFIASYFPGFLYCFFASTGQDAWNYTTGGYITSSPAVANGRVYIGSYDGKLYCLDEMSGSRFWSYDAGSPIGVSPTIVGNKIYFGTFDGNVYCLDAVSGLRLWKYTTPFYCRIESDPAVSNGIVYIGCDDWNVYALDAVTGALKWTYTTGNLVSSPAVAEGMVYVGSLDGNLYCLDALTGSRIWSYATGGPVEPSPAIVDGILYNGGYGMGGSYVYAIGDVLRVPQDYGSVQAAVNAADSGDTIMIAPGVYHECVVVNKRLTIVGGKGDSDTAFQGGGSGVAITLSSIASGSTIAGIVITNYQQGICLAGATDCKIYDTSMSLISQGGIVVQGSNAARNMIYSNSFQNIALAINLTASSTTSKVYKNIINSNPSGVAINLASNGNTIYGNIMSGNQIGIKLTGSSGNKIYHNNFEANNVQVVVTAAGSNVWDDGYPSGGNYWSDYQGHDANGDGIGDTPYTVGTSNGDNYPLVKPLNQYDVGITNLYSSQTVVDRGLSIIITLKMLNYGTSDVIVPVQYFVNNTLESVLTAGVMARSPVTLTLPLSTTGYALGHYNFSALAGPVSSESDVSDNYLAGGWFTVCGQMGDLTGSPNIWSFIPDGKCNILDVSVVAKCFGSYQGAPPPLIWNANCDITGVTFGVPDGKVNILDVSLVARHFGEPHP